MTTNQQEEIVLFLCVVFKRKLKQKHGRQDSAKPSPPRAYLSRPQDSVKQSPPPAFLSRPQDSAKQSHSPGDLAHYTYALFVLAQHNQRPSPGDNIRHLRTARHIHMSPDNALNKQNAWCPSPDSSNMYDDSILNLLPTHLDTTCTKTCQR